MKTLLLYIIFPVLLMLAGCSTEPEPINYGHDQCHFCKMTIVDENYGAEMVTPKGKIYKFDAAECLINYLNESNLPDNEAGKLLVVDTSEPRKLTDARKAHYLISQKLKSPMGENISSFKIMDKAEEYKKEYGGDFYDWETLRSKLENK